MAASMAGDVETVLGLMADDVVFMVSGRDAFEAAAAERSAVEIDGTSELRELEVIDDWAYLRA